jgi:protein O-mannosyl-transferase
MSEAGPPRCPPAPTRPAIPAWVPAVLIPLACWAVFLPALHGGWMWDDRLDVVNNPLLRSRAGLWRIWFDPAGLYDYYPLKFTVQWVQWHLWHNETFGYHATNVVLHAIGAGLVWRVLARIGLRHAWLGGLLFAVHPLVVESVAWISELKNTLSLPLFLGAVDRYLVYDERGRRRDYALALAFFLAAMLCKTSVVALPAFLLVYAWWRRGRIRVPDLLATLPFLGISIALGGVTLWFQRHAAIGAGEPAFNPVGGWLSRLACVGSSAAFYLGKALFPTNLMPIYLQWPLRPPPAWTFLPWLGLIALGVWSWRRRATWGRHVVLGLGWFGLFAAPVLGFVTITSQRFTWVMDHLVYVPLIGLIGLATAGASRVIDAASTRWRAPAIGVALALCAAAGTAAYRHARHFADEETLWTYNAERNPQAWLAYFSLGKVKQESHRTADAIADYQTAIRLRPDYADAYYNLANTFREVGRTADAIAAYRQATRLKPSLYLAHGNLAVVLAQTGQLDDAIRECERALAANPRYVEAHYNLGSLLVAAGRAREALPHFAATLRLNPNYPGAENNYAIALGEAGQPAESVPHFERALAQAPQSAEIHNNLGSTLRELGRLPEGISHLRQAVTLQPKSVNAWFNLGCAYAQAGQLAEAAQAFERTLQLKPDHAAAQQNLALVRQATQ